MAWVDIGLSGGVFDGASGTTWMEDEVNSDNFYANSSATGIITLTGLRITVTYREVGFWGAISVDYSGVGPFYQEDETGTLVTVFTFPAPIIWTNVDNFNFYVQFNINYHEVTLVSIEAEGTGDLFGEVEVICWDSYVGTTEVTE